MGYGNMRLIERKNFFSIKRIEKRDTKRIPLLFHDFSFVLLFVYKSFPSQQKNPQTLLFAGFLKWRERWDSNPRPTV